MKFNLLAGVLSFVPVAASMGGITAVGGSATLIPAPPSTVLGANQSGTSAWAFNEAGPITLAAPVEVNVTAPGLYTSDASLTPGIIPAGTTVFSHYLYSDPVGGAVSTYEGFVEVDQPIIGIMVLRNRLNATDAIFGAPGTLYADNSARGLELATNADSFRLTVSGNRVEFVFRTSTATDDIRIITVPGAGATGLAGVALTAAARRRRR